MFHFSILQNIFPRFLSIISVYSNLSDANKKNGPRLLYVITEDWFFCSHFIGRAQAAKENGYEVRDPSIIYSNMI